MKRDELYVEELLCNDAAKIVIDEEFKNDLKNKIMFGDKYNNITELPKRKNNFMQNRYLKIASGFVICVFVSGTIFRTIDVTNRKLITKGNIIPDVIMPIATNKISTETTNKKTEALQPQGKIVNSTHNKQTNVVSNAKDNKASKVNKDNYANNVLAKNVEDKSSSINKNVNNGNFVQDDEEINNSLVAGNKYASVSTDVKGPIDVPTMEAVTEKSVEDLKCYDSRYSFDEKRKVSVKNGGIYIKDLGSSTEKKLISYNKNTHIVDKPNFTPNDDIIYYKAEKVTLEKGVVGEKNGAIYISDKNGQESTKIVDGESPMVSKDGEKLVYEAEGKVYILTLSTNAKVLVDIGKYPAWADNGNLISYVKEDREKRFSSLWVFDLETQNTRSLTNNEVNIRNNTIESWAEAVRSENITSNSDVTSPYSYFESIWSSTNKEVYVIRKNNEAQVFEFIRFNLDN